MPTPIAPEVTRMISRPPFCRSLSTRHSDSTRRRFSFPFSYVSVEVPTFTTTRFACVISDIGSFPPPGQVPGA